MQDTDTDYTIHNVKKALELLEKLAEFHDEHTLASLAESISYSRTKTFRLLATLNEKGLVDRDPESGVYSLGEATAAFGKKLIDSSHPVSESLPTTHKPLDSANLVNYSHPIMERLANKYHEAVYMTVIKDNQVLFLNMVDTDHMIKAGPLVGMKFPFFTNAAGKVMKAVDSWDLLEKLCKRDKRPGRRPDMGKLASEMEAIRVSGVAVDNGGLGEGIISVAVAVRDYAGKVVGAITMLGPSFRMLAERIDNEIIPSLQEGADLLSRRFGYAPI
jgi:DNA-binding IclR family transcriptional regulator